MRVHVVHLPGRQLRIFQGELHDPLHAVGVRIRDVAAVAVRRESDDLRVDAGAPCPSMLEVFEDQRGGSLSHDEAVTVPVERPRRSGRLVVARRGGEHDIEDGGIDGMELLGSSGHHDALAPEPDGLVAVADPLAPGRTGAARRHEPSGDAEEHGEVRGAGVAHELDVIGGRDALDGVGQEIPRVVLHGRRAPGRRAIGDTGGAVGQNRAVEQSRVLEGQLGRPGGE